MPSHVSWHWARLAGAGAALLLLLMLTASTALARAAEPVPPGSPADPAELEAFLNAVIPSLLQSQHIAGATVAVVSGDTLLLAKGYGLADVETRRPVLADQTLFDPGSVAKLFTHTAVMQLVEQGTLDLHADVNVYLRDVQVPATYPQPVTLAHLLSHSAGFEDQPFGIFTYDATALEPLGAYLARSLPARVRPPGEVTAYSNHGVGLAGYIVEQVSGMSFERYVEQHILRALGMERTTLRQPVPVAMAADVSESYAYRNNGFIRQPAVYRQMPPTGSMFTTATDMAKFMIAHLQGGRYEDVRILGEATAQQMRRRLFSNDAQVSGWAYGFMEMHQNNQRILCHTGFTPSQFSSLLALIPEKKAGVFISFNGAADVGLFLRAFLDHYYPVPPAAPPQPSLHSDPPLQSFAGDYRTTSRSYTGLLALFDQGYLHVTTNTDGTLSVTGLGAPLRWVRVEPLLFRLAEGHWGAGEILAFRAGVQGSSSSYFFLGNDPLNAYERVPWHEIPAVTVTVLGACCLLFLSALPWLPHGRRAVGPGAAGKALWRWWAVRRLAGLVAALNLLFVAGFALWVVTNVGLHGEGRYLAHVPLDLAMLLLLPLVAAGLNALCTGLAFATWREHCWSLRERILCSAVVLGAWALAALLKHWHLLGFSF